MLIRPYCDDDLPQVKALHQAQGVSYELPDVSRPSFLVRAVIEENGQITSAAFLRKTAEMYWIVSPEQSKRDRLGKWLALNKELVRPAARAGFEDIHAFVCPEIMTTAFHRTLLNLGWVKPLSVCYSRKVEL